MSSSRVFVFGVCVFLSCVVGDSGVGWRLGCFLLCLCVVIV